MHSGRRQSDAAVCGLDADPYLNTDAGTMSPFEHGEVFVLDDGGEVRATIPEIRRSTGQAACCGTIPLSFL